MSECALFFFFFGPSEAHHIDKKHKNVRYVAAKFHG